MKVQKNPKAIIGVLSSPHHLMNCIQLLKHLHTDNTNIFDIKLGIKFDINENIRNQINDFSLFDLRTLEGRLKFLLNLLTNIIKGFNQVLPNLGNSRVEKILLFFSTYLYVIDDGLSSLWYAETASTFSKKKQNKIIFFTKYAHILKKRINKYDFNIIDNLTLQKKIKKNTSKANIFIGGPYIDYGWITFDVYKNLLNNLMSEYCINKLLYYPHTKENIDLLKTIKNITIINRKKDLIEDLYELCDETSNFYGCFSSGLVDLKVEFKNSNFFFFRLPGWAKRKNEHFLGFNVEKRIYKLLLDLKFKEILKKEVKFYE